MGRSIHKVVTRRSERRGDKQSNIVRPVIEEQGESNITRRGLKMFLSWEINLPPNSTLYSLLFKNIWLRLCYKLDKWYSRSLHCFKTISEMRDQLKFMLKAIYRVFNVIQMLYIPFGYVNQFHSQHAANVNMLTS